MIANSGGTMFLSKALRSASVVRGCGIAVLVCAVLGWRCYLAWACPFCSAASQTLSQELAASDVAVLAELIGPAEALPDGVEEFAAGEIPDDLVDALPEDAPSESVEAEVEADAGENLPLGEGAGSPPATPPAGAGNEPRGFGPPGFGVGDAGMGTARFRIVEVLHGSERLAGATEIEVVYFGEDVGKQFLISGIADQRIDWTTPLPLGKRAVEYVRQLEALPDVSAERLLFFQNYLEDEDPLLAQDAYDEFARTPYPEVQALGPQMPREKLLAWIESADVGPSSRRLFLTMLGICGKPEDVDFLEKMLLYDYQGIKPGVAVAVGAASLQGFPFGFGLWDEVLHAEERRKKESLDALTACYLTLKGPTGLELVNEKFLGNPDVEYKYLHSAIMALRFHGEETEVLPREDLLASMRLALNHREFADQVIPDLTRWEDWSVMPRLVGMFEDSPQDDWIRQPVASYLLVAAEQEGNVGAEATQALERLERLDPDTVKRSRSLAAFSFLPRSNPGPAGGDEAEADPPLATAGSPAPTAAAEASADGSAEASIEAAAALAAETSPDLVAAAGAAAAGAAGSQTPAALPSAAGEVADAPPTASPATQAAQAPDAPAAPLASASEAEAAKAPGAPPVATAVTPPRAPGRLLLVGVPLLAGLILAAIFAVLLRGADPRSADRP